jgi:hypothetical protein
VNGNPRSKETRMMRHRYIVTVVLLSCTLVGLIGCERQATEASARSAEAAPMPAAALPSDLFVDEAPADARSVAEVKADISAIGDGSDSWARRQAVARRAGRHAPV